MRVFGESSLKSKGGLCSNNNTQGTIPFLGKRKKKYTHLRVRSDERGRFCAFTFLVGPNLDSFSLLRSIPI